jgi:hypothetical protein
MLCYDPYEKENRQVHANRQIAEPIHFHSVPL